MSERQFREWMSRLEMDRGARPNEYHRRVQEPPEPGDEQGGAQAFFRDGVGTFRSWQM